MAVVTVQRFVKAYPEFKNTTAELVQQKLDEADELINDATFGDTLAIRATMVKAAALLSLSPEGEQARFWIRGKQKTMYEVQWDSMVRAYTFGSGRIA